MPDYTNIPFLDLLWPACSGTAREVAARLRRHLEALRSGQAVEEHEWGPSIDIPFSDLARIQRRAERYVAARDQDGRYVRGLDYKDRDRLERLRDGARVVRLRSEHRADEIASVLHGEMPWLDPVTEKVWHEMRRSVREGHPGLRLSPMLLVGPPGIGKSRWARRLAQEAGLPSIAMDAAQENASFAIAGSQQGWSSARPGRPMELVLDTGVANGLIVIDEIEKAGTPVGRSGLTWSLSNALLALLEQSTAREWSCPYFRVRCDMSWLSWVLTANSVEGLQEPLLSRVPPTYLKPLTTEQLTDFALRQAADRGLEAETGVAIAEIIEAAPVGHRPTLRTVLRMVERAEAVSPCAVLH